MNFNFKNLSENTKRIRIIPKYGAELSVNVGVDNPTAMIDVNGVISVCLSPNETPTISCDGAIDSIGIGDINYEHVVKVNGIEIDLLNDVISSSDGIYTVQKGDIIFLAKLEIEAAIGFKNNSVNNLVFEIDVSSNPYDEPIHTNWIKPVFGQPDNPTYYYDAVNKIITFCLSPYETPTISCDGATAYADFAFLVRDGVDPSIIHTDQLQVIVDGEVIPATSPTPNGLEVEEGAPFPYEIPNGFQNATLTPRFYNLSDVNRRVEVKSLSEDIKVFTYNNPTSIQLNDDNSHAGACLSVHCEPNVIRIKGQDALDVSESTDVVLRIRLTRNSNTSEVLIRSSEIIDFEYGYNSLSALRMMLNHIGIQVAGGGGGIAHFVSYYGNSLIGGYGTSSNDPITIEFLPYNAGENEFDLYSVLIDPEEPIQTVHSCGLEYFYGI